MTQDASGPPRQPVGSADSQSVETFTLGVLPIAWIFPVRFVVAQPRQLLERLVVLYVLDFRQSHCDGIKVGFFRPGLLLSQRPFFSIAAAKGDDLAGAGNGLH